MTKVIIISGGNLDSYYEQMQQYLHAKYHNYPTNLPDLKIGKAEKMQSAHNDAMALDIASGNYSGDIPIGKLVV